MTATVSDTTMTSSPPDSDAQPAHVHAVASPLATAIAAAKRWMFESALPLWSSVGRDHTHGGFVEHLTLEGRPADVDFKRVRVQARQIYVFSHAALLGWDGPALEAATDSYRFVTQNGWRADGGWVRRLTRAGAVMDDTLDLYDQAFVAFALAWRLRATGDDDALMWAQRTLEAIDIHLAHPGGEGYWHWLAPTGHRQQNPHMHLFEALVALHNATGDDAYLSRGERIADLFAQRFYDAETRTLSEFFTDDWSRAPGEDGLITEPGHQFEWCWLLFEFMKASHRRDLREAAVGLYETAMARGVDAKTGLTYDEVLVDGTVRKGSSRSWPQTEALKAHLAMFESTGRDTRDGVLRATRNLLDRYLAVHPRGAWIDHFDADGAPMVDKVPASTLYHVFLAFAELIRLEDKLLAT